MMNWETIEAALVCAWLVAPVAAQVLEMLREGRADA